MGLRRADPQPGALRPQDPALEAEQILRDLARGNKELRGEHANALIQVGTVRRELGQGPQSLAPDQEAVALLRELAATDKGQRRNLGRALTGLGLSYGAMGRLEESLAISQ